MVVGAIFTLPSAISVATYYFSGYTQAKLGGNTNAFEYSYTQFSNALTSVISTLPVISSDQFTDSSQQAIDGFSQLIAIFLDLSGDILDDDRGPPIGTTFNLVNSLFEQYYSRISLSCEYLPAFSSDVSLVSAELLAVTNRWPQLAAPLVTVTTCASSVSVSVSTSTSASASASISDSATSSGNLPSGSISSSAISSLTTGTLSSVSTSLPGETCAATLSSIVFAGTVYACRVVPSSCAPAASSVVLRSSSNTLIPSAPGTSTVILGPV